MRFWFKCSGRSVSMHGLIAIITRWTDPGPNFWKSPISTEAMHFLKKIISFHFYSTKRTRHYMSLGPRITFSALLLIEDLFYKILIYHISNRMYREVSSNFIGRNFETRASFQMQRGFISEGENFHNSTIYSYLTFWGYYTIIRALNNHWTIIDGNDF